MIPFVVLARLFGTTAPTKLAERIPCPPDNSKDRWPKTIQEWRSGGIPSKHLPRIAAAANVEISEILRLAKRFLGDDLVEEPVKSANPPPSEKRFEVERSLRCRSTVTVKDIADWHPEVGKEFIREFFRTVRDGADRGEITLAGGGDPASPPLIPEPATDRGAGGGQTEMTVESEETGREEGDATALPGATK